MDTIIAQLDSLSTSESDWYKIINVILNRINRIMFNKQFDATGTKLINKIHLSNLTYIHDIETNTELAIHNDHLSGEDVIPGDKMRIEWDENNPILVDDNTGKRYYLELNGFEEISVGKYTIMDKDL